jgi:uncharacterized SAM-binding protein YcdF (DUF218 family)
LRSLSGVIRRHRRLLTAVLLLVVVFIGFTARLFIWPDLNTPTHADAIVVLGGAGNRVGEGVALADRGIAPLLVLSLYPGEQCPPSTRRTTIRCFHANPLSTRGEARATEHLARQLHLHRIILVVTTPQATRARLRVGRCFPGQIEVVGVSPGGVRGWLVALAYEWGALFKALVLQPSC